MGNNVYLVFYWLILEFTPQKDAFQRNGDEVNMADGAAEEDVDEPDVEYINWSLRMFADRGPIERNVKNAITSQQYNYVDYEVSDDFFENKYLPFSFIIPNADNEAEQHEFYSSVFRNINILGTPLNPIESRQSLYFLKSELQSFFNPECCRNLKVELVGKNQAYDFVRTMAILSQYKKDGRSNRLAQGYKPKMEKYYEEYIYMQLSMIKIVICLFGFQRYFLTKISLLELLY